MTNTKLPHFIRFTSSNGTHYCECGRSVAKEAGGFWSHVVSAGGVSTCTRAVMYNRAGGMG